MNIRNRKKEFFKVLSIVLLSISVYYLLTDYKQGTDTYLAGHLGTAQTRAVSFQPGQTSSNEDVARRNDNRLKRIRDQCTLLEDPNKKSESSFQIRTLTDPNHSIIYCRVNKAASTYILDQLGYILNCNRDCLLRSAGALYRLPTEDMKNAVKNAYSFMFVREPYGRLFSTYCNKFYFPKGLWAPLGPRLIKMYRKNPSQESLEYGHDVTFTELIQYTVDMFERGKALHMDVHVGPMHIRCDPCHYHFDFIGKLETLKSDWMYLTSVWMSRNISKGNDNREDLRELGRKERNPLMIYFKSTLKMVKESNIKEYDLYERSWRYFQIIGSISKYISMPYSRSSNRKINFKDFFQELELAINLSKAYASEVKDQQRESMLQAYSSVPLELLERLRKVVLKDCLLYGYDARPDWLFDRKKTNRSDNSVHPLLM